FVDAGNLFTDERFSPGLMPADVMIKNRWVVKGYGDFRHDAANVNYNDLPYLSELLKKEGYDSRAEEFPFIRKLVSANIQPVDDSLLAPAPYVIREITLKRSAPGSRVRVGITGFTDGRPEGPVAKGFTYAGYKITDPFEAAKRVLPELKKKADVIIVLAYMPQEQAARLANENPEIDTIIGAKQISSLDQPQHFNRATVIYAFNQTKHLGEMRYYVKGDGSVENQINRYVALDDAIPDDPDAVEIVTAAHNEFTEEQNRAAQKATPPTGQAASLLTASSPFAGVDTCAACHVTEYDIWKKTGHSHAMQTLENKNQQFDTECVKCHVVGFEKGGFQSLVTTPQYANVQCESCHGPGKQHAESPAKGYGLMQTPVGCMQCHTQPNSPDFEFKSYWEKVKH
ncbi:MAG: hypothetical protein L0229_15330, partial [Blastocatellia bacterium]|nr:hypothetical protein [Blastocatellia bacterium]